MRLDPRQPLIELMAVVAFAAAAWLACLAVMAAGPAENEAEGAKLEPVASYDVRDGDSLSEIALAHGVILADLMRANELEDPDKIFTGTTLIIPGDPKNGVVTKRGVRLTVPKGITLSRIAELYGIPWKRIARANRLKNPDLLREGQRLLIPGATAVVELIPPPPCYKDAVTLFRVHNGETHRLPLCFCDGRPNPVAVKTLSNMSGPLTKPAPFPLHPRLVQLLQRIADKYPGKRIEIISGQRVKKAKKRESYHNRGKALDFRVEGVSNKKLQRFVRKFNNVGVGYYPNSVFIHIDTRDRNAYWIDYSRPGEKAIYGRVGMTKAQIAAIRKKRSASKAKPAVARNEQAVANSEQAEIESATDAEHFVEAAAEAAAAAVSPPVLSAANDK
jgi:LysM repeat protein